MIKVFSQVTPFYNYYPDYYSEAIKATLLKFPDDYNIEYHRKEGKYIKTNDYFDILVQYHFDWYSICVAHFSTRIPLLFNTWISISYLSLTDTMISQYANTHDMSIIEADKECKLLTQTAKDFSWQLFCIYSKIRNDLNDATSKTTLEQTLDNGRIRLKRCHVL